MVPTSLYPPPADEVHFAAQDVFEFGSHSNKVEEAMFGSSLKGYENIDVAAGAEILADRGSEDG